MKVAVTYNVPLKGRLDSEDVLQQVNLVVGSLKTLGHEYCVFPVGGERGKGVGMPAADRPGGGRLSIGESVFFLLLDLKKFRPQVIFNLIEETPELNIHLQYFAVIFELFKYNFTGAGYESTLTTTDKALSKLVMNYFGIPTPQSQVFQGVKERIKLPPPWIVKPALEDASVGIDDSSVFTDETALLKVLPDIYTRHGKQPLIIERFIDGREFNISLLENEEGEGEVLPVAEMVFRGWPGGKPKIVGYRAKWDSASFEFKNTVRHFDPADAPLERMKALALKCWKVFNLRGYARVDLRMDRDENVYVIEANANPCISSDSGFMAAAQKAGLEVKDVVSRIINSAFFKTARAARAAG